MNVLVLPASCSSCLSPISRFVDIIVVSVQRVFTHAAIQPDPYASLISCGYLGVFRLRVFFKAELRLCWFWIRNKLERCPFRPVFTSSGRTNSEFVQWNVNNPNAPLCLPLDRKVSKTVIVTIRFTGT